ncbi:MAG: inovirus-type Gp2 protein [Gammaproteobacteria bacterium]|nr:inovirus-type Gp2 protein [Gammaproteobacteria bacterium]
MSYITYSNAITVNNKTWWVNSTGSGLYTKPLKAMINQVEAMLSHHSRVFLLRFDLRLYQYTAKNTLVSIFNRRLFKWLYRKYDLKRIGFLWCREQEKAEQQHYHYALLVDGSKVRHPFEINKKVRELWRSLGGAEFFPKSCYYNLHRSNWQSVQDAVWRISYFAKARGKDKRPSQTKRFGHSRVPIK